MKNRFRGALVGLACVDALGQYVEFKARDSYPLLTEFKSGGTWGLKEPGTWTDDTSMALCLADSLIESNGFSAKDQLEKYTRWFRDGFLSATGKCFDIGIGTRRALARFERTGETECDDPNSGGNGSIMRLCPVPLAYYSNPEKAIQFAGLSSKTTHGAREATDACRLLSALIVGALQGREKAELLSAGFTPVPDSWTRASMHSNISAIAFGSYKKKTRDEIKSSGYCVDTLEAALWAFWTTDSFEAGAIAAVNLGEDTDSIGAVYGQIAGAFYGCDAIPVRWRDGLIKKELVLDFADRLFELSKTIQ